MRRTRPERWQRIGLAAAIVLAIVVVLVTVDSAAPEEAQLAASPATAQAQSADRGTDSLSAQQEDAASVAAAASDPQPSSATDAAQAAPVASASDSEPTQPVATEPPAPATQQEETQSLPDPEQVEAPPDSPSELDWRLADRAALAALTIAPEYDGEPRYDRDDYNYYLGRDENGCNLRDRIILRDAAEITSVDDRCDADGEWISWLDGRAISDESHLQIDHLVALAEAHRSGGWQWDEERRRQFFNDDETLSAVSGEINRAKSDLDPAEWKPPNEVVWCRYAREWIEIKLKYELTADQAEVIALAEMLESCSGPSLDSAAQDRRTTLD